jgi:hypothetical protein
MAVTGALYIFTWLVHKLVWLLLAFGTPQIVRRALVHLEDRNLGFTEDVSHSI